MAAYASLVSLMHLIEQIKHHPDPPVYLDPKQAQSLTEKISFLQGFLEDFHSRGFSQETQALESRITDVVHGAEDVIESQILLALGTFPPTCRVWNLSTGLFYEGLPRVIQDMEFIEKEAAMYAKKKSAFKGDDQLPPRRSLHRPLDTTMVGFDHILIQIMDRLTRNKPRRDVVPIVGMGGAGKTTLARNIYENKLIVEYFDTRLWATISQEYVVREVLIEFLLCLSNQKSREALSRESEGDLGEQLYKSLCGRKYLIVMDDVWDVEAWGRFRFFFPDNNNGSRIMVTSRLWKLAVDLTDSHSHVVYVDLLDEDTSWDLLYKKVFAEKICPFELEEIGRRIARNCRGLPLSIVTIGGLLAKSGMMREYWEYVAENLSSLVNSEDDERCLRILSLSYIHLPVHLKPCFLYMGLFPEDMKIRASHLIRLWVAEGFLKPISGKALELVGEDYLNDLAGRNLVSVDRWGSTGRIKNIGVHDLLRDLCLREAQRERFFSIVRIDNLQCNGISKTKRRIAIHCSTSSNEEDSPHHGTPCSLAPFLRTCIIDFDKVMKFRSIQHYMRILAGAKSYMAYDIVPLVNSRFLCLNTDKYISSLWSMSWNLQTLVLKGYLKDKARLDIWKMPQLRNVKIKSDSFICLPDPPPGRLLVLENLQMLSKVKNFKCSEEVVKRIPNINKLGIWNSVEDTWSMDDYCLDNLGRLQNLESLSIGISRLDGLTLPHSLKKLTLKGLNLDNDVMSTMIGGSLPLLEKLKLASCDFVGEEWNPVEGQFCCLKYLRLFNCKNLKHWNNADSAHFPRLEVLVIEGKSSLEEFPWGIGDIPTLELIELFYVSDSLFISAKRMLEEQEEQLGNVEGLEIRFYITAGRQQNVVDGLLWASAESRISRN